MNLPFIRKAQLDDFNQIIALNQKHFIYEEKFTSTYNRSWPYLNSGREYFARRLVNDTAINLVLEDNNTIEGYLIGFISYSDARTVNPIAEIETLFFTENFREKGYGSKMINMFKDETKKNGAKRLKVMTYSNNLKAINFYKSKGFEEIGLILEQDLK